MNFHFPCAIKWCVGCVCVCIRRKNPSLSYRSLSNSPSYNLSSQSTSSFCDYFPEDSAFLRKFVYSFFWGYIHATKYSSINWHTHTHTHADNRRREKELLVLFQKGLRSLFILVSCCFLFDEGGFSKLFLFLFTPFGFYFAAMCAVVVIQCALYSTTSSYILRLFPGT